MQTLEGPKISLGLEFKIYLKFKSQKDFAKLSFVNKFNIFIFLYTK